VTPLSSAPAADDEIRRLAASRAVEGQSLSGHPDVSWSVVLDATVAVAPALEAVAEGLHSLFESRPWLGLSPIVREVDRQEVDASRSELADTRYRPDTPLVRVVLAAGPGEKPGHVLLAAHHAVSDGLGLLTLLGTALGHDVHSRARGLRADANTRSPFALAAARRLAEATLQPCDRVRPMNGDRDATGDLLLHRHVGAGNVRSADLIASTARAIVGWNGGRRPRRLVLSLGASRRPGEGADVEDDSAYLRVTVTSPRAARIAKAIAEATPEPAAPADSGSAWLARAARFVPSALSARMGSTALVSSLGTVTAPALVRAIAFYPVAHGRSGVAIGHATIGSTSVVTLRCRRRDFSEAAAGAFLDRIGREIERSS
jgi:hypothetical protein